MINVSQAVLDGIEAVRVSGKTNMLDYDAVMVIANKMGYHKTVVWMHHNRKVYAEGLFAGFEAKK